MMKQFFTRLIMVALIAAPSAGTVLAQGMGAPLPAPAAGAGSSDLALNFSDAPLEFVLQEYSEKTGKTLLRAPGLPAPTFTLHSQGKLGIEDYLKAIETVLTMNGVGLVESGDKFVRVVPIKSVRREALEILETIPESLVAERSGTMVSQMITLKHIDIAEATKAIDPMRNENGQINPFERTNAIMVTDVPENINRMLQVLRLLDQPVEAREEPKVIQIRYAKAADIKARLLEIIAESQKDQATSTVPRARTSGAPGVVPAAPPGIIRPSSVINRAGAEAEPEAALIDAAERGIIRGKVQIVSDERTNQLIIITRPENMAFFERIIHVLDVETSPDVMVKVLRLDFATAEDVASMLNDLIGATQKNDGPATAVRTGDATESKRLAEVEAALARRQQSQPPDGKSSVGELSKDNIKILSDKRTNSLILMASKADLATLVEIVNDMDMMLSQVLIEAVIIDVSLDNSLETGVSWVQKSMTAYSKNAAGVRSPVFSFAGGGGGSSSALPQDATRLNDPSTLATSGLGYFFTMFDLNMNMILKASAADSRARVVSTPALLTTDNTEAKLTSTERIYVFEGTTYSGTTTDNRTARYSQADVGLSLTVKPQINQDHVVMMEIKQEVSEPGDISGDTENLTGQRISISRTIEASVAVKSGQTIVLGGQVRENNSRSRSKIPLLGDIPILGRLFNSDRRGNGRTETIVFITPYVLDTPEEVNRETQRRRDSLNIQGMWKKGWSGSELAEPVQEQKTTGSFPRKPVPAVKSAPVLTERPVTRVEPWTSSDGKVARGGDRSAVDLPAPAVETVDPVSPVSADHPETTVEPVDPVSPVSADQSFDDVDTFIREQQRKWDSVVKESPAKESL